MYNSVTMCKCPILAKKEFETYDEDTIKYFILAENEKETKQENLKFIGK